MTSPRNSDLPDFDAQWNFDDPAASERAFRAILEEQADAPKGYRLALRTQIARALGLRRKFSEAHAVLDEVEAELEEEGLAKLRYLLERGRVLNSSSQPEPARPLFEAAMELGKQLGEKRLAVDAAHMVAITLRGREALDANLAALALAEAAQDPGAQRWRGSLYNNIGWSYHDLGDYQRALEYFEKGVAFRREQGQPAPLRIARWTVGRALRSLKRYDEALSLQRELLREEPDAPFVHEEIGECLLSLGEKEAALPHFQAAYAILKDDAWLKEKEPERIQRLGELAGAR
jgi:tetratricopeptide (TPR) repeat protein